MSNIRRQPRNRCSVSGGKNRSFGGAPGINFNQEVYNMEKITDPLLLKETATRGQVAVVYGVAGLILGALFFGRSS